MIIHTGVWSENQKSIDGSRQSVLWLKKETTKKPLPHLDRFVWDRGKGRAIR